MTEFPPLTHVALTVRDLDVSVPWYEALLDARPVIDEDTDPNDSAMVFASNGELDARCVRQTVPGFGTRISYSNMRVNSQATYCNSWIPHRSAIAVRTNTVDTSEPSPVHSPTPTAGKE